MSAPLSVRRGDSRRAYLETHVFELLIAALGVIVALTFYLDPAELARTAVGRAVHPFDYGWNGCYLVGGALIVAGLVRPSYRLEVAGLIIFGSAIATALVALLDVTAASAVDLGSVIASGATSAAALVACIVRVATIRRVEAALAEAHAELELLQPPRQGADRRRK